MNKKLTEVLQERINTILPSAKLSVATKSLL